MFWHACAAFSANLRCFGVNADAALPVPGYMQGHGCTAEFGLVVVLLWNAIDELQNAAGPAARRS